MIAQQISPNVTWNIKIKFFLNFNFNWIFFSIKNGSSHVNLTWFERFSKKLNFSYIFSPRFQQLRSPISERLIKLKFSVYQLLIIYNTYTKFHCATYNTSITLYTPYTIILDILYICSKTRYLQDSFLPLFSERVLTGSKVFLTPDIPAPDDFQQLFLGVPKFAPGDLFYNRVPP